MYTIDIQFSKKIAHLLVVVFYLTVFSIRLRIVFFCIFVCGKAQRENLKMLRAIVTFLSIYSHHFRDRVFWQLYCASPNSCFVSFYLVFLGKNLEGRTVFVGYGKLWQFFIRIFVFFCMVFLCVFVVINIQLLFEYYNVLYGTQYLYGNIKIIMCKMLYR